MVWAHLFLELLRHGSFKAEGQGGLEFGGEVLRPQAKTADGRGIVPTRRPSVSLTCPATLHCRLLPSLDPALAGESHPLCSQPVLFSFLVSTGNQLHHRGTALRHVSLQGDVLPVSFYQSVEVNMRRPQGREVAVGDSESTPFTWSAVHLAHLPHHMAACRNHQAVKHVDILSATFPSTATPGRLTGTFLVKNEMKRRSHRDSQGKECPVLWAHLERSQSERRNRA